jgi:hypothetical protein
MGAFIDKISWEIVIILVLTVGLAPYKPPHVWEKLVMLSKGTLNRPIDWFDLLMHGAPWVLLILKAAFSARRGG